MRAHLAGLASASRLQWRVFGVLLFLSLLPVLVVDIPAGVDVPNHLARMGVLAREDAAHPFYYVRWGVYPNLAMDLLVPPAARALSNEVAVKAFYLASQLLVVTGAIAIELVRKRRFELAGFGALALLYSIPFAWGFMNFTFGCGIALWGLALHLACQHRSIWLRLLVHTVLVVVLFVSHFFALGIYAVAVGLVELSRWWPTRWRVSTLGATAAWLAAPVVVLLITLQQSASETFSGDGRTTWFWSWKFISLFMSVNGYSWTLSAGLTAGALVLAYLLVRHKAVRADALAAWFALALGAAFLAMPFRLFNTAYADVRVVVAAALILPSFLSVTELPHRIKQAVVGGATALFLVNLSFVTYAQLSYDRSYDELVASFGHIQPGSRVFLGINAPADVGIDPPTQLLDYPMYNAPVIAVSHRDAFVPNLFTAPGKQPLVVRSDVHHLDIPYGAPVPIGTLRFVAAANPEAASFPPYMANWHNDYDYLVVVGKEFPRLMPDVLERLDGGHRFTLYRIR